MKNTMKKLLCMALAIMLLVSAVPFTVGAVSFENQYLTFAYKLADGTPVDSYKSTQAWTQDFTDDEITNGSKNFVPAGYDWKSIDLTPSATADNVTYVVTVERHVEESVAIVIKLIVTGEGNHLYNVGQVPKASASSTMSKADAIVKLAGRGSDYEITTTVATAETTDSEYVYPFVAEKKSVTPPTSTNFTLTVNYTGDRSGTVTLSVPANTNVTATDVANAIKSQLGVSSLSISGFPTVTVTENTTIGGVKVSGINAVNYVLTIKVSGDYTGTASKTVPAGTSVTEADVKAAVKSALGITDNFNVDVPGAPIVMNCSQTVYVNATKITGSSSSSTNKFPYDVYLNIYKDTLVGSADKSVKITNGIALDGLVTLPEVKNVVKNYYTAKDSDGISYDGLYLARGNWVANYVADTEKYDSIKAGEMQQTGTVYINVMIGNAKAKSSSTADSSNPKTGDTIFVPVMVLGLTASALAAAYVIGKKRFAR